MAKDISRKSVMILVSVALVVSILSTLFVLQAVYTYQPSSSQSNEVVVNSGTVKFRVPQTPPTATMKLTVLPDGAEG